MPNGKGNKVEWIEAAACKALVAVDIGIQLIAQVRSTGRSDLFVQQAVGPILVLETLNAPVPFELDLGWGLFVGSGIFSWCEEGSNSVCKV